MSMYNGAFVGVGYIVSEQEREALFRPLWLADDVATYNDIMDECFWRINEKTWFFGEKAYDLDEFGEAKSVETLAVLPALNDNGSFGEKYGDVLLKFGLSIEEINTKWCSPQIYFVYWVDY